MTIGEIVPIRLFAVFMMLPTVPLPPRGATSEGNDQPIVDAVVSALTETVIQTSAQNTSVVNAAPMMVRPDAESRR